MENKFSLTKLEFSLQGKFQDSWRMAKMPVNGTVFAYTVVDRNIPPDNSWTFYVLVPDSDEEDENIIVRPEAAPYRHALVPVERRAITFSPGDEPGFMDKVYCKVFLADPTGNKTKIGVRYENRDQLPDWMSCFEDRMQSKDTVRETRGTDGKALVISLEPKDHEEMIRVFIATRAWPLLADIS